MQETRYAEGKQGCRIRFLSKSPAPPPGASPTPIGDAHESTVHLVEFRLDERTTAWFGKALIGCDLEGLQRDATAAGLPARPGGYGYDPGDFSLEIALDDGRDGLAVVKSGGFEVGKRGIQAALVEFVGVSRLN